MTYTYRTKATKQEIMKNSLFPLMVLLILMNSSCTNDELEQELTNDLQNEKIKPKQLISNNCSFNYGVDDVGNPIGGGDPIGGGNQYNDIVDESIADFIVNDLIELKNALNNPELSAGKIIYIR